MTKPVFISRFVNFAYFSFKFSRYAAGDTTSILRNSLDDSPSGSVQSGSVVHLLAPVSQMTVITQALSHTFQRVNVIRSLPNFLCVIPAMCLSFSTIRIDPTQSQNIPLFTIIFPTTSFFSFLGCQFWISGPQLFSICCRGPKLHFDMLGSL